MAEPKFRMSSQVSRGGGDFTYHLLSDDEKRHLCYDLLSEFGVVNVTERGDELVHSCVMPWHHDRNPSAQLNYRKLTYSCFSCGSSGGLLWLIGTHQETSATDARRWLESKVEPGVGDDSEESLAALLDFFDAVYSQDAERDPPIPVMSTRVLDPWRYTHPYITEIRGVPEGNVEKFDIGYGVLPVRQGDTTIESHRVIVPHFWDHKLVGWQSRRIIADGTAKWISSPDFPKKRTMFNHDLDCSEAVVVEAPLSAVAKDHVAHFVALFGASFSDQQVKHLSRYEKVILWMDNDEAGWGVVIGKDRYDKLGRVTEHVPGLAERLEDYVPVWVVDNPYDADPADMDDELVAELIETAIPFAVWNPPEEVCELPIRKHGAGEILPDDESEQPEWTNDDGDELVEENDHTDRESEK